MSELKVIQKTESFDFTIIDWNRDYGFEVNRQKWELSPGHYAENDIIYISGRLRSNTKRNFLSGKAQILPSFIPREQFEGGADRIGNVWTDKEIIFCSAFIPADAYFSLPACLAKGKFIKMSWLVKNLRYRKGELDSIQLKSELSEAEAD